MGKIYLFGGTSEIGGAIATKIIDTLPGVENEIIRITTSEVVESGIRWNPTSIGEVKRTLEKLDLECNDIVIISIGTLREVLNKGVINLDGLDDMYRINQHLPIIILADAFNRLSVLGGGNIIVLTSTAAFPVLDENFVYGSAKSNLDAFAKYLQKISKSSNVKISIVRSSFVATKLNANRKPTPFSLTANQVARIVVRHFGEKVIWTPKIFQTISFFLTNIPALKLIANHLIRKSKV